MKLLVDTHVFLWATRDQARMPARFIRAMSDPAHAVWLSAVSVWEVRIKEEAGKLSLSLPVDRLAEVFLGGRDCFLPVTLAHAAAGTPDRQSVETLDPFDRMLLAQCHVEGMKLLSADGKLKNHPPIFEDARDTA